MQLNLKLLSHSFPLSKDCTICRHGSSHLCEDLLVRRQPDLCRQFQDSQGYIERPVWLFCLVVFKDAQCERRVKGADADPLVIPIEQGTNRKTLGFRGSSQRYWVGDFQSPTF